MRFFIFTLLFSGSLYAQHEPLNPYAELGQKAKVATLSNGKYQESFQNDTLQPVGNVIFNRINGEVIGLIQHDTLFGEDNLQPQVVSRWLGPDPLAGKFPNWSPYNYTFNNPVFFTDPDGRSGIASIDTKNGTVTISAHFYVYGSGANADVANSLASNIENMWNAANGVANIDGKEYRVVFDISASYVSESSAISFANDNKSRKDFGENFLRVENGFAQEAQNYPGSKGSNSIIMSSDHACGSATVAPHEFGHSLGHMAHEPYGQKIDGQPNIFSTKHNPVDAPYTVDPSQGPTQMVMKDGKIVSTTNPMDKNLREVTQKDIDYLNLGKLKFNALGKANVGDINNVIYDSTGNQKN